MELLLHLVKELILAWKDGSKVIRLAIVVAVVSGLVGIIINTGGHLLYWFHPQAVKALSTFFGILGGVIVFVIYAYRKSLEETESEQRVERAEQRAQENPNQPQAAWDLARIKLESYLNRNLNQVRSIFWLTSLVMIVGFIFIGFGVAKAFESPESITPALLSAGCGLLVNFIGATFLVLYKSTMQQAKEYVAILERINAVGMSVQVLEKLEGGDDDLRYQTTADLSKQLLALYQPKV